MWCFSEMAVFHWGTSASTKVPMLIPVVTVSNVWIFKNRLGGHYVPLHCIFQGWWRVLKEPGRNAIMDLELKEDRTRKIDKHPQKTLGSDAVTASCHSNVKLSKLRYLQTPISTLRYIYMYYIYMYNIYI